MTANETTDVTDPLSITTKTAIALDFFVLVFGVWAALNLSVGILFNRSFVLTFSV
jgi:hypothetical protein